MSASLIMSGKNELTVDAGADSWNELLGVIDRLRGENGCPWDRKQTLDSLKPCLVEECYELLEAIETGDPASHLDELGDVLLQVLLQARIRSESGDFDIGDVASHLSAKLIRRHPHVFGDAKADTPEEVLVRWAAIKKQERSGGPPSPAGTLDGLPRGLPSLHQAQKVQQRAAGVGFDWSRIEDVFSKVEEELDETRNALANESAEEIYEELGDLLFSVVNLCRFRHVHAEDALRSATQKFKDRFHAVERRIEQSGQRMEDCSLEELDRVWEGVKQEEKSC